MNKPNLKTERMSGAGSCGGINYLKGLDDLCKFFKLDKSKTVLELGVNTGVSTSLFAFYAKEVVGVDIIKTNEFEEVIKKYGNVSLKHGSVADVLPTLPDQFFDLIYVDANHHYESVKHDILISLPKLKQNGIICGHDYLINSQTLDGGVDMAVRELFPDKTIIIFQDSSWAVF